MELKEILLVDERAPIVSAISYILQSKGYLVLLAPDAETAAEELENYHFDLILAYLTGDEEDKLDLLRRAKERSPQSKVMVAGNPRRPTLPIEAFQMEVDDYLLAPFSAPELCRRVEYCLGQDMIFNPKVVHEEKGGAINGWVLDSLRLKFCDINNTLFSLIAHIKILFQENHDFLNYNNFAIINGISDDLFKIMNVTEDFLYNQLIFRNNNDIYKKELKAACQ